MSEGTETKHVAAIWIFVVLAGSMSVPFWRSSGTSSTDADSTRWQGGLLDSSNRDSNSIEAINAQVNAARSPERLNSINSSDPFAGLGDAGSRANSGAAPLPLGETGKLIEQSPLSRSIAADKTQNNRPPLSHLYQPQGLELTEIPAWNGIEARKNERAYQPVEGLVRKSPANSASRSEWPDAGFQPVPQGLQNKELAPENLAGQGQSLPPGTNSYSSSHQTVSTSSKIPVPLPPTTPSGANAWGSSNKPSPSNSPILPSQSSSQGGTIGVGIGSPRLSPLPPTQPSSAPIPAGFATGPIQSNNSDRFRHLPSTQPSDPITTPQFISQPR